ncbi:MAG: hypothetical protein WCJ30_28220, partial [Deltaproteobacteria bacterium]
MTLRSWVLAVVASTLAGCWGFQSIRDRWDAADAPTDHRGDADVIDVTDVTDVSDATDALDATDVSDATDVLDAMDVSDATDALDAADAPAEEVAPPLDALDVVPCLCAPGLGCCAGACVDLSRDVDHCGSCDQRCP